MKTTMMTLAAAAAVAASAPALAQFQYPTQNQATVGVGAQANIANRIAQLDARLQAGVTNGAISRTEERSLRQQIRALARLERQYSRNGLTQQERRDLQQRVRSIRQQLRAADNDQRYANWNDDSYYADDDVYGGYNPRGNYGNHGNYNDLRQTNQVCAARAAGIGNILGAILGSDNCLRVGERVTTSLAAVPNEYRNRFPTRSGYRYGFLEGSIVEVDSRTGVVTNIYAAG